MLKLISLCWANKKGCLPEQKIPFRKTVNQPVTLCALSKINTKPTVNDTARHELELEVMEFFVRAAQLLGQPRSLGEIYGLLYMSPDPLSMDEIVTRLKISTGSVSQGLKQLRAFRAVRTTYLPGTRRDHFVAEQELRKVLNGFVQEEIRPHLESGRERVSRMGQLVVELEGEGDNEAQAELAAKIKRLARLHSLSDRLLPLLMRFV